MRQKYIILISYFATFVKVKKKCYFKYYDMFVLFYKILEKMNIILY